jgi:hypothetical protein
MPDSGDGAGWGSARARGARTRPGRSGSAAPSAAGRAGQRGVERTAAETAPSLGSDGPGREPRARMLTARANRAPRRHPPVRVSDRPATNPSRTQMRQRWARHRAGQQTVPVVGAPSPAHCGARLTAGRCVIRIAEEVPDLRVGRAGRVRRCRAGRPTDPARIGSRRTGIAAELAEEDTEHSHRYHGPVISPPRAAALRAGLSPHAGSFSQRRSLLLLSSSTRRPRSTLLSPGPLRRPFPLRRPMRCSVRNVT